MWCAILRWAPSRTWDGPCSGRFLGSVRKPWRRHEAHSGWQRGFPCEGLNYAADTRGYTVGLLAEYHDRAWAARFGEMLMPTVANGLDLEFNLRKARAE